MAWFGLVFSMHFALAATTHFQRFYSEGDSVSNGVSDGRQFGWNPVSNIPCPDGTLTGRTGKPERLAIAAEGPSLERERKQQQQQHMLINGRDNFLAL